MTPSEVKIGTARLFLGDCREVLPGLRDLDAIIVDPPYSSGGQFRSDRAAKTSAKYVKSGAASFRGGFSGDNKDQRAFLAWASLWLSDAFLAAKDGAVLCAFTDWRQLPVLTDAVQGGGWVWRNIVTWWKPGIRMQRGRFSGSAEYLVYASRGVPTEGEESPQNVLKYGIASRGLDRLHIAEKPIALLAEIIGVSPPYALVCDPFMGSGTTGVACVQRGRSFIGIEIEPRYFDIACERIAAAQSAAAVAA